MILLFVVLACGGKVGECELGSAYGDEPAIDPAAPAFSDEDWTQEQVQASFAALESSSDEWRSYAFAASEHGHLLECAFCACGCSTVEGHLSAADCFKDMHGLDCGWCQQIALRAEELVASGMGEEAVREALSEEYPQP